MQDSEVWTADRAHAIVDVRYPRHGTAVVEAQGEFHANRDTSAKTLQNSNHVREALADRHEVDQLECSLCIFECGLKDQRVVAIFSLGRPLPLCRTNSPEAVLLGSEQRGKARFRREVRP